MSASPFQISLSACSAMILAEPLGNDGAHDTMTALAIWSPLSLYLAVNPLKQGLAVLNNTNGFLLPANTILSLTLKPYEVLYGYSTTAGLVYVLRHVSDHARSS